MVVLKLKSGNFIKGGVLAKVNQDIPRPQWMSQPILRLMDRLVLMIPIMKELSSSDAEKIFRYLIEVSDVRDFPVPDSSTDEINNNPFLSLYSIMITALKKEHPHVHFLERVTIKGSHLFIDEFIRE